MSWESYVGSNCGAELQNERRSRTISPTDAFHLQNAVRQMPIHHRSKALFMSGAEPYKGKKDEVVEQRVFDGHCWTMGLEFRYTLEKDCDHLT
jgi:hypothetical protein